MAKIPASWDEIFNSDGELQLIDSDQLMDMLKVASNQCKLVSTRPHHFATWELRNYRKLVTFIFDLLSALDINDNYVKYNTCDLFETFLNCHIELIKDNLAHEGDRLEDESRVWNVIKEQALLRLMTCTILSSKLSSSFGVKHLDDYAYMLKRCGKDHTKLSLIKSEVRVMQTVKFKVDQCPVYSICPMLILTLAYNEPTINGRLLYTMLHKVLDYYYLAKADILNQVRRDLRLWRSITYEEFKRLVSDSMLISCAIVAVTPMLVDEESTAIVLGELVFITCYDEKEIEIIRNVIYNGIFDEDLRTLEMDPIQF